MATDNEVVIHVRAKDETGRVFSAVRAKAVKLGDDVTLTIRATDETEAAFASAGRRAKELDDSVNIRIKADDETGDGFERVKEKIKETGEEFVRTSSRSGQQAGQGMLTGITRAKPQAIGAMVGVGLAVAPQLGATIAGAVVGAGGFTGIAGGMLIAARDTRVQTAARNLGELMSMNLKSAATAFVPASVEAIDKVRAAWKGILPTVQNIFTNSAQFVGPMTDSLIKMTERIVEGIDVAVSKAGPVMEEFGDLFEEVGDGIGDLFEDMAGDAEGGAQAIGDLGVAMGDLLRFTGDLIGVLTALKGVQDGVNASLMVGGFWLEDHVGWLDVTRDGYAKGSEAAELYRKGVIGASGSANDYNNYLEEQKNKQEEAKTSAEEHTEALQRLAAEMQKQTDPLFNIFDLQSKVVKAQEDYNKALNEGGPESAKAQKALLAMGRAAFELNTALGNAADGFDGKLTPSMRTALRNAGMTESEMNALEKSLIRSYNAAKRWEGTFEQTFYVREIITSKGERTYGGGGGRQAPVMDRGASGKIKGAASGMVTGSLTWVGEQGPELLRLPPGSQVHSNPDSQRMAAGMGGDGAAAGGPVVVNLMVDQQTIAYAILPSLQALNRTDYAGDVTRMFPAVR